MFRYFTRNLKFTLKDMSKNILKALVSSFGILFLISFLVLYLSLRSSVKEYIGKKLFGTLAINEITIYPRTQSGSETFSTIASKSNAIPPWKVVMIRKLKEFSHVYGLTRLNYEVKVKAEFLGKKKKQHVPVFGIDTGFFRGKERRWKEFRNTPVLPVILPRMSLAILNQFTSVRGLPQFNEKMLIGFPGKLQIVTTNYYSDVEKKYVLPAKLHSFTSALNFTGILVPNTFISEFTRVHNRDTGKYKKGYSYVRLFARVKDIKQLPSLTAKLKKMNLKIESQADISRKTNRALEVVDGLSLLIVAVVLLLTVIAIFNSYLIIVHNRSYGFSLKRVIGVSKIRIVFLFILEAALIGALYGVIGFYTGNYLTGYMTGNLSSWIPVLKGLTFKPAGIDLLLKAVLLSVSISSLSAFIPALFASNMSLFKAVKKTS